jgi:hypothetical protein
MSLIGKRLNCDKVGPPKPEPFFDVHRLPVSYQTTAADDIIDVRARLRAWLHALSRDTSRAPTPSARLTTTSPVRIITSQ